MGICPGKGRMMTREWERLVVGPGCNERCGDEIAVGLVSSVRDVSGACLANPGRDGGGSRRG
jgi:hypothetical protein